MDKIRFWKKISDWSFYACLIILAVITFILDVSFYSLPVLIAIISLVTLITSSLILYFIKKKGG